MLKIRLQGTTKELKWFKKILERDRRITVLSVSEPFANKICIYEFVPCE